MKNVVRDRPIRVGVLGALRGKTFMDSASATGMELACVCDNFPQRLEAVCSQLKVPGYAEYDEFLRHDMDAVIVAGPFHQHAMFARKALRAGKHVLSETSCNVTLAEGVELYRLAEETGLCYMLAENYCYTRFNQEMKRLYDAGEIGEVRYAEGEYNHPATEREFVWGAPGRRHWRNCLPACYYNTHALAPLMYVTGTHPVAVSCTRLPDFREKAYAPLDSGFVMLVRMDNGAIFRLYGPTVAGHSCWYGFHGTVGAMESGRGHGYFGPETVRVWHEPWDLREGQAEETVYFPRWPHHGKEADAAGHGGGDFFVELAFATAIGTGEQPYLNAYRGITLSNVGILAWRSVHQNGAWLPIPDLRDGKAQAEMLKDRLSPFPDVENSVLMPPEMLVRTEFNAEIRAIAREEWKKQGYTDAQIEQLFEE